MNTHRFSAFFAGMLSGGLYLLLVAFGFGFFFLFIPSLPLLSLALRFGLRPCALATLTGALVVSTMGNAELILAYLSMLGFPSCYIARYSLMWKADASGTKHWYPLGLIFSNLAVHACLFIGMICFYLAQGDQPLPALLEEHIRSMLPDMQTDPAYIDFRDTLEQIASNWSFLMVSVTAWLWSLAVFAHGWAAQRMLAYKNRQVRPDFAITPFNMPNEILALLAIASLCSFAGNESLIFWGKTSLVVLLLPYFYSGAALMHRASTAWVWRKLLLFFIYFITFTQFWPALLLSGYGFWMHIKRLSTPASSSSN